MQSTRVMACKGTEDCCRCRSIHNPARSCSTRGLPSQPVAKLLVGSYPTISPLPFRAVSFCCTFRRLCCYQRCRLPVRKRVVQRSSDFPHNISVARLPVVPPYPTDQILPSSTAASTSSATSSGTSMRPHASHVYILSRLCFISITR